MGQVTVRRLSALPGGQQAKMTARLAGIISSVQTLALLAGICRDGVTIVAGSRFVS
jgi:undecaprenyl pyrophosphate phosphatase UppP